MGEIAILYGQTDHYKTFLSLKIALEVASGSQELGATQSGRVILINTDTDEPTRHISKNKSSAESKLFRPRLFRKPIFK